MGLKVGKNLSKSIILYSNNMRFEFSYYKYLVLQYIILLYIIDI